MKKVLWLLALALLCGCTAPVAPTSQPTQPPTKETVPVENPFSVDAVADLPRDFLLGMDASCVPALEAGGVRYKDAAGQEKDVFQILRENGINCIRVRVWNHPFDDRGRGYGGGNCDLSNALAIGKRCAQQGLPLLVDFHYSDFWADPGKQMVPKAWKDMDLAQKADALYRYTKESLQTLVEAGVQVAMVQLGNETNGGLCGETQWASVAQLMNAGARAVREVCPEALVAVHFTNPEKTGSYKFYGETLAQHQVDYDVFASSYYPYWHGTLENLSSQLSFIAETYGKQVMIAETSYAYTPNDTDFYRNTIGAGEEKGYPFTPQGQASFVRDLVAAAAELPNCLGVFYWEGTWISAGGAGYSENRTLWETHGSGWASSFASAYDPEDAGKWFGGCAVDNQAFFDKTGRATEALQVFSLVRPKGE